MIAIVLAVLVPLAAVVEEEPLFLEARGMYDAMDLEGALARFELVLLNDALTAEERALVLMWTGLAEADLGRFDQAETRFADALVLAPEARLPVEVSPRVQELVEAARAKAAAREPSGPDEDSPVPDVTKGEDGTVSPRGPGVLIPSSGRARDAYGNEVPDEPPPPAPVPGWLGIAGWTAVTAGLLVGAGGAALLVLSALDVDAAANAPDPTAAQQAAERAQIEGIAGGVTLLAGVGLAAVGGALLIVGWTATE